MDLVVFLIILLILGDWAPIPEPFKAVLHWLVIAIAVIWLISLLLGLAGYDAGTRFPVFRAASAPHKTPGVTVSPRCTPRCTPLWPDCPPLCAPLSAANRR